MKGGVILCHVLLRKVLVPLKILESIQWKARRIETMNTRTDARKEGYGN